MLSASSRHASRACAYMHVQRKGICMETEKEDERKCGQEG